MVIAGTQLPLTISIDGVVPNSTRAVITSFRAALAGKQQFLHTLEDLIYVYTFGEAIGALTISGVCFSSGCNPTSSGATGVEEILAFYELNKLSTTGRPITLQIGTTAAGRFYGFLVGCNVDVNAPEHQLGSFSLAFQTIPTSPAALGVAGAGGSGGWLQGLLDSLAGATGGGTGGTL